MSEKLSKDELVEELDTMLFRACADCFEHEPSQVAEPMEKRMGQACEQLKQLIKAQAEPSEKELEELVIKYYNRILKRIGKSMFTLPIGLLSEMLKEYDELRRG